jgi:hypothetical protein
MTTGPAVETYEIGERFDKALKLFRFALAEVDLEIAAEFGSDGTGNEAGSRNGARTFLVEAPLLSFEALALDRAAALFFPIHVVVTPMGATTRVEVLNIARLIHARLPAGAQDPIDRLAARIRVALESVSEKAAASAHGSNGSRKL